MSVKLRQIPRAARVRVDLSIHEMAARLKSPLARSIRTHWAPYPDNFGDMLTPWILPKLGVIPHYSRIGKAELLGVGSTIQRAPQTYQGAVWGSGLIRDTPWPLPDARFLALRGSLTADRVGAPASTPLGDPGLLSARFIARPSTTWDLGLIPHKVHQRDSRLKLLARRYPRSILLIDVRLHPRVVAEQIASCAHVLSSSLHGVVVADSFSIPAAWFQWRPELAGGDFKFRDHDSAVTDQVREMMIADNDTLTSLLARMPKEVSSDRVALLAEGLDRSLNEYLESRAGLPKR